MPEAGWTMLEGISCAKMIDIVNQRTDRRASDKLDMQTELMLAAQEVCLERRWWWRRITANFLMTPGTAQYDLTAVGFPSQQQITKGGVKVFPPFTTPPSPPPYNPWGPLHTFRSLDAVFEVDRQDTITILQANGQCPLAQPVEYFMVPGTPWVMNFNPIPDQAYPVIVAAWSVPMWNIGAMPTQLPLVPENLYALVLKRLEMHATAYILGEDEPRYQNCANEYQVMLERLAIYTDFAEGKITQMIDTHHEDTFRSTH